MATVPFAQWLARGRAHQWEGRPVDAMLCFRQAARLEPRAPDARFHLGEVLWQLGRLPAAVAAWREATAIAPAHVAAWTAIAEASLAGGDYPAALEASLRVLALTPDDARADAIAGIASLAAGAEGATARILAAFERAPALVGVPTVAGPLALVVGGAPAPDSDALIAALAPRLAAPEIAKTTAPLLLALAAESAAAPPALLEHAAARGYAPGDHDALRRLARAACRRGAGRMADPASVAAGNAGVDGDGAGAAPDAGASPSLPGTSLGLHYARLCNAVFASPVPLVWPRRTAGAALRVVVLAPAAPGAAAQDAVRALASLPAGTLAGTYVDCGGDGAAAATALGLGGWSALTLSGAPGLDEAKVLAAIDADLLIDLAGLDAAVGPLLAARPARVNATLRTLPAPLGAPLIDIAWPGPDALVRDVERRSAAVAAAAPQTAGDLSAHALAAAMDAAVEAHRSGDAAAAVAGYERVLGAQPDAAPALLLAGIAQRDAGDAAGARARFDEAVVRAPDWSDARAAAIRAAVDAGDAAAAAALVDAVPPERLAHDVALLRAAGTARLAARDGAAAAAAFERALLIEPTDGETHYNHGVALQQLRDRAGAARAYQRALTFAPDLVAADYNLGVLFQEQGATDAAVQAFRTVLAAVPRHARAHKNLGETLRAAGRIDAFVAAWRAFESACPDSLAAAVQGLEALQLAGDLAGVEQLLEGLRGERFRARDDHELVDALEELLYLLLFFDIEPSVSGRFARTYDTAATHVYGAPLPPAASRRPGRLRIGYLSADLRDHVMGRMMWAAIAGHDRDRFALHFYALSDADDAWTAKFRGVGERFERVGHLDEAAAARLIAADDLDVLVDLGTHTRGARPGILAKKPARVQITHVASAGCVGLAAIDFKLTDRCADLPENQAHQLETLLPMDACVYPFHRITAPPAPPPSRAALGLPADAFVLAAFVTPLKLSRRCLKLWRDVLERIPRAWLAFSPLEPALRPCYERLARAAGLPLDRIVFLPAARDEAGNLARYAVVDAVLDPTPFGNVNGVLEPLQAGVPVVTLLGRRHGERSAYTILAHAGVDGTVAQSGREYVDIVARLAGDATFREGVVATIRAGMASSPLVDLPAHTRALERAYLAALAARAPAALADNGFSPADIDALAAEAVLRAAPEEGAGG